MWGLEPPTFALPTSKPYTAIKKLKTEPRASEYPQQFCQAAWREVIEQSSRSPLVLKTTHLVLPLFKQEPGNDAAEE